MKNIFGLKEKGFQVIFNWIDFIFFWFVILGTLTTLTTYLLK